MTNFPLLHEAADEGRLASENAARFPDAYRRARRTPLGVVFSSPQIVMAGQTHQQLIDMGIDFETDPAAEHLSHLLAWSIDKGITVSEALSRPFYHPVIEEGLRTGLRDINSKLGFGPNPPLRYIDCGPGA